MLRVLFIRPTRPKCDRTFRLVLLSQTHLEAPTTYCSSSCTFATLPKSNSSCETLFLSSYKASKNPARKDPGPFALTFSAAISNANTPDNVASSGSPRGSFLMFREILPSTARKDAITAPRLQPLPVTMPRSSVPFFTVNAGHYIRDA